nr:PREDICTED: uncharacterized protein LOC109041287 [Bemisia tabaci]
MDGKVVYISVDDRLETLHLPSDVTPDQIRELLRSLCQVTNPQASIWLVDAEGRKLSIDSELPANSPENPYRPLARPRNGMLVDEVEMEFISLEQSLKELEEQADNSTEICSKVKMIEDKLHKIKNKLETSKHNTWINFYKEIPPSIMKLQYRRLSDGKQSKVRKEFYEICNNTLSEEVRQALRLPSFDCSTFEDAEILHILQYMYIDFDLPKKYNIDLNTLREFLFTVYKNYNDVPFHNFRHSFCVTQMMYAMCMKVNLKDKIGDLEILVLLTSCICHDLDHPGYNNMYQINAKTELAIRYNDISPLENHHCSMAFRILDLPSCNIFSSMTKEVYRTVREGIIRCILATDMSRHNEILQKFVEAQEEQQFDFENKNHVNLLEMVLIKVADISNEARPMEVADPWLDKLLQEFYNQSDLEKDQGLPVTPFMDRAKISKSSSQCNFIGIVLLPLFEALEKLFPELKDMIVNPVKEALAFYQECLRNEQRTKRTSVISAPHSTASSGPNSPIKITPFVPTNNTLHKSQQSEEGSSSRASSQDSIGYEQDDNCNISRSEDDAAVNEVTVSEQTSTFKIATDNPCSGKKSQPGSRKGSREKAHLSGDSDLAHFYTGSVHSSDSGEKKSWSSSEQYSIDENRLRHDTRKKSVSSPEERKETRSYSYVEQPKSRKDIFHDSGNSFKKRSASACSSDELKDSDSRVSFANFNYPYRKKSITPCKSPELKEEEEEGKPASGNVESCSYSFAAKKLESNNTSKSVDEPNSKNYSLHRVEGSNPVPSDTQILTSVRPTMTEDASSLKDIDCEADKTQPTAVPLAEQAEISGSSCCQEKNSETLVQCVNSVKNVDQASTVQSIDIAVKETFDGKPKVPSPQSTVMKRLKKSFGDPFRLSRRSTSSDSSSSKLTVAETSSQPASPASLKTQKTEEVEEEQKAMTLPKVLKKRKSRKWRVLKMKSDTGSSSTERLNKDFSRRKSSDGEARGISGNNKIENGMTPPDEDSTTEAANNNKVKSNCANIGRQKKSSSDAKYPRWMSTLKASFNFKKSSNS